MTSDRCDTVKNLERECAMRMDKITVQQAYRMSDNQRARNAWASVMEWTGPHQRLTPHIYATFKTLANI